MRLLAAGIVGGLLACAQGTWAEPTRDEIRRVPVTGSDTLEVVVSLVTIEPGDWAPVHSHVGDEHMVIINGSRIETASGEIVEFPVGLTLSHSSGAKHGGVKNVGEGAIQVISVHIVPIGTQQDGF